MTYLVLTAIAACIAALGFRALARKRRRAALLAAPLSGEERQSVFEQVPLLQRLPDNLRANLEGRMNLFLDQVEFIGCDGLEVTEQMELSIAAQASLLVVNSDQWYKNLTTVLIYPGAFKSLRKSYNGYVVTERETIRTGESWSRGPVILSWADSEQGARDDQDGHNVVLHEFAHQLDDLSGHTDGAPLMSQGQSFAGWKHAFVPAFESHVKNVEAGRKTVIDPYGATGYEEFFAVTIEMFFERPAALKADEPEVYAQVAQLLKIDPASWPQ